MANQRMKRRIGKTGIEVSAIGLGAMPLSIQGRPDEKDAMAVVESAIEAGTTFLDTANVYCIDDDDIGHNEKLIRKTLDRSGKWGHVTVATKGGLTRPQGRWETDGRPESLREACEKSLRDLNLDKITLYQFHAPDSDVPFEKSIEALARLKEEGKVEHLGLSNVSKEELQQAQKMVRIETVQNRCHPFLQRDYRNGLLETCIEMEVTFIPHSPVGGHLEHQAISQNETLQALSRKYDCSAYRLMLAWHLAKGEFVLPIPGASRVQSAQDSPKAVHVELDPADVEAIDQLS